jgi:hypothetical protein
MTTTELRIGCLPGVVSSQYIHIFHKQLVRKTYAYTNGLPGRVPYIIKLKGANERYSFVLPFDLACGQRLI